MTPGIRAELHRLADPVKARVLQGFFKTGAGQYGEGDVFLGVTVPAVRAVARRHPGTAFRAIRGLLHSRIHEERLLALLLLVARFETTDEAGRKAIFDLYLAGTRWINNWDLVDLSADKIVGAYLDGRRPSPLFRLARSASLWERRIAIVATAHFIRQKRFTTTLRLSVMLLGDTEDLIHKAVGWMLREVGKRDSGRLEVFLARHGAAMPRTMLRYAIERFPEPVRQRYLRTTRAKPGQPPVRSSIGE